MKVFICVDQCGTDPGEVGMEKDDKVKHTAIISAEAMIIDNLMGGENIPNNHKGDNTWRVISPGLNTKNLPAAWRTSITA